MTNAVSRPIPLLLLTLCGCLTVRLARQVIQADDLLQVPETRSAITVPALPDLPAFDPPPAEMLVEILGRPIFDPTRKPFDPEAEMRNAPPPPPQVKFLGTMSDAGQLMALIKDAGAPAVTVKTGAIIAGWQITDISPERIQLSAKSVTMDLKPNRSAPAPARLAQGTLRRTVSTRARRSTSPGTTSAPSTTIAPVAAAPILNPNLHFRGVQVP